jgi:hypothetical protein
MKFILSFKNPCVDTEYVKIVAPDALTDYVYIIGSTKISEAHDAFTIETKPIENHGLCGALTYTMKVDGESVSKDEEPIGYTETGRFVTIYS